MVFPSPAKFRQERHGREKIECPIENPPDSSTDPLRTCRS
ncbi:MAG: hypothetical protein QOJ40_1491 [Verrucomicrobiota bacterium]